MFLHIDAGAGDQGGLNTVYCKPHQKAEHSCGEHTCGIGCILRGGGAQAQQGSQRPVMVDVGAGEGGPGGLHLKAQEE